MIIYVLLFQFRTGTEGEGSMGGTEDLDIEVDVVETSEPEDLAANRYHRRSSVDAGNGKHNGSTSGSKKKRSRETVSASSEDGDRTPPPHDSAQATSKNLATMLAKCTSPDLASTECYLESVSKELWSKFHELGTEMIITKTGRYASYFIYNIILCKIDIYRYLLRISL